MDSASTVKALAGIRIAIGVSAWLTPRLAGKGFGLDAAANPQSPYLARLFGVRDVALGVGALQSTGEARRQWLALGLVCDVADTAAALFAGRAGYLSPASTALVAAPAIAAVGFGALALRDGEPAPVAPAV